MQIKVTQFVYGEMAKPDCWFSKYVEPINRAYCELHGYSYLVEKLEDHNQHKRDRHGYWEKPMHLLRNLNNCDYLFFMDADACKKNTQNRQEKTCSATAR